MGDMGWGYYHQLVLDSCRFHRLLCLSFCWVEDFGQVESFQAFEVRTHHTDATNMLVDIDQYKELIVRQVNFVARADKRRNLLDYGITIQDVVIAN